MWQSVMLVSFVLVLMAKTTTTITKKKKKKHTHTQDQKGDAQNKQYVTDNIKLLISALTFRFEQGGIQQGHCAVSPHTTRGRDGEG